MQMKRLILFDIDGTLTVPRNKITVDMVNELKRLQIIKNLELGFVGGSDLSKQIEQIGIENMNIFTWKFSENGLYSFYKDEIIHKKSITDYLGEDKYQKLINVILEVLSETIIPVKRGNFIELRNGLINISPIGRSCSQEERESFYKYDLENNIREKIIDKIKELYEWSHELTFSIGGQISVDIFPKGWDKTYSLQFVEHKYDQIYFFGDKTMTGGNDYEIYNDKRVIGNSVITYNDTIHLLKKLF
jgi:phosphomannomutase